METKNEELKEFVEDLKIRNEEIEIRKLPTAEQLVGIILKKPKKSLPQALKHEFGVSGELNE